jgi:anti-sigma B factor antagonist
VHDDLPALVDQPFFWIDVVPLGDAVIVLLGGEVDLRTAHRFAEAVSSAFARGSGTVVLDISRVEFFAAAGIHVLDQARELAQATGSALRVVVDDQRLLLRMLRVAGLRGSLSLFHELDAALHAVQSAGRTVQFG